MSSFQASEQGKSRIKQARIDRGWNIDDPRWLKEASEVLEPNQSWTEQLCANGVSLMTWKLFLDAKKGIKPEIFKAFSRVLGLNWQEIRETDEAPHLISTHPKDPVKS